MFGFEFLCVAFVSFQKNDANFFPVKDLSNFILVNVFTRYVAFNFKVSLCV